MYDKVHTDRGTDQRQQRTEAPILGNIQNTSDEVGDDEMLGPEDARLYRGAASRLNYIAPDRPDIAYTVKESARGMSAPRASAMRSLCNIGTY